MENDFIDLDAVCELTGLTRADLAQLRYRGEGAPFYSLTPRRIRYKRSEVIAWMEGKRRTSTADTSALAG